MPIEMNTLRQALDQAGISWDDDTTDRKEGFPFIDMSIYRTKFRHSGRRYVAVGGYGVYGSDLLELMIDNAEPISTLTAKEIMEIIDD